MKTLDACVSIAFLLLAGVSSAFAMSGVGHGGGDTPEPSTLGLVAIGLIAGGYVFYRGRRQR